VRYGRTQKGDIRELKQKGSVRNRRNGFDGDRVREREYSGNGRFKKRENEGVHAFRENTQQGNLESEKHCSGECVKVSRGDGYLLLERQHRDTDGREEDGSKIIESGSGTGECPCDKRYQNNVCAGDKRVISNAGMHQAERLPGKPAKHHDSGENPRNDISRRGFQKLPADKNQKNQRADGKTDTVHVSGRNNLERAFGNGIVGAPQKGGEQDGKIGNDGFISDCHTAITA